MRVEVTGPIVHLCPYRDEIDHGEVRIVWADVLEAPELHGIRRMIDGFRDQRITHEAVTLAIREACPGAQVDTRWNTAGFAVECST